MFLTSDTLRGFHISRKIKRRVQENVREKESCLNCKPSLILLLGENCVFLNLTPKTLLIYRSSFSKYKGKLVFISVLFTLQKEDLWF